MRARIDGAKVVALFGTVLLATAAAGAGEGRIPVFGLTIISQPGHYVVTRDITSTFAFPVVTIGAPGCTPFGGVTLDLNGHTLTSAAGGPGVIVIGSDCTTGGVTIRNGRLVGGGAGSGAGSGILSTLAAPLDLRLENVEISNVAFDGLFIESARVVHVERCSIHDVGYSGLVISGETAPFQGTFIGNTLTAIRKYGIRLEGLRGGAIKDNVISNYGSDLPAAAGILLSSTASLGTVGGTLIEGNTLTSLPGGTDDDGLVINGIPGADCPHNLIVGNTMQRNGNAGAVIASDGNRIERNVLSRNPLGMQVGIAGFGGLRNHLEGNSLQFNTGCGLSLTTGGSHTYRNNIGGANGTSGLTCLGTGNTDLGGNSGL